MLSIASYVKHNAKYSNTSTHTKVELKLRYLCNFLENINWEHNIYYVIAYIAKIRFSTIYGCL
jgi:hypothetical protein